MDKAVLSAVAEVLKEERTSLLEKIDAVKTVLENQVADRVCKVKEQIDSLQVAVNGKDQAAAEKLEHVRVGIDKTFKSINGVLDDLAGRVEGLEEVEDRVASELRTEIKLAAELATQELDESYDTVQKDLERLQGEWEKKQQDTTQTIIETVRSQVKDGKDGEPGKDGRDGLDRITVAPRRIEKGDQVKRNELVIHDGGLWQAVKKTNALPTEQPGAYISVVNGLSDINGTLDVVKRVYTFTCTFSDGFERTLQLPDMPRYISPESKCGHVDGDFWFDDEHLHFVVNGEWQVRQYVGPAGKQGQRGRKGAKGSDGIGIEHMEIKDNVLYVAMTDGEVKEFLLDIMIPEQEEIDQEIRRYAGGWRDGKSYSAGDVVSAPQGLYLALRDTSDELYNTDAWARMQGSEGGLMGGGGGGGAGGWPPIVSSALNMQGFRIDHLADPRSGTIGSNDATNREWVEKAIAAGALYQGTWQPVPNTPSLIALTDSGFKWPAVGKEIGKPAGASHTVPGTDVGVWFNITPAGWSGFPWQVVVPIPVDVWLSNGEHVEFNINPQTFQTQGDFRQALRDHIPGSSISDFAVDNVSGELWVSVETTPPVYPILFTPNIAGGYPESSAGAKNTVLNTYNWVVQTADPNTPEVIPPGIPGIPAGTLVRNSDILQWSSQLGPLADPTKPASATNKPVGAFEIIRGGQMTQSFSDQRYWQVKGRNFEWRADDYPAGSVVLHNNVWFQATQQIGVADPEPGNVASAAIWRKINASHGATTFFGAGDWIDYPNLQPVNLQQPLTAANNWGMPAGTIPSGQQPEDQDIYYDILSGSRTTFGVTKNPPAYTISGTVDTQNAPVGEMSLGQMAGHQNYLNFINDGSARKAGDYLQLIIPADFTTAIDAAATATWNGPLDATTLSGEIPSIGNWVDLAGSVNASAIAQQYETNWGQMLSTGGAILRIAQDGVFGVTDEGFRVVDGCIYVPPNVWGGVGGGTAFPQTWNTVPASGHFVGQNLAPGTYYVIWSGDNQADNNGWALIDNQAPLDWAVNTPNPQQVPDTVTASRVWGYRRNFEWTVPASAVDDDVWGVLVGFPADDNIYHVVLKDEAHGGSIYEFEITTSSVAKGRITPISVLASNDHFKEIILGWNGTDHYFISVKTTGDAAGVTYRIEVDTPYPQGIANVHVDTIKRSNVQSNMDATKNYPTDELTNFLQALSGDASKATAVPGRAPGQNVGGATIALEGGKVYRQSGYYLSQSGFTPLVSIYHDKSATNKLLLANADIWSNVILRGDNKTSSANPMDNGGDGWFSCLKYAEGVQANTPVYCEVTLDLRDPNKILFKFQAQGRFAQAGNNVHFHGSTTIIWPVDPAHDPTGYGFYFSGWNADAGYTWFMFRDS